MRIKFMCVFAVILALCTQVEARYGVATMAVSAIVRNACTANTEVFSAEQSALANGAASNNATGEIEVDCSVGTPYSVALNTGTIKGASVKERDVTTAAGTLSYGLYSDGKYTEKWGTVAGPEAFSGTSRGAHVPKPMYGRLVGNQRGVAEAHPDMVTVSVNY